MIAAWEKESATQRIYSTMSIRLIARELYQLRQKVEALEEEMETAPYDKRTGLERKLQRARGEVQQMRKLLDGRIDRQT